MVDKHLNLFYSYNARDEEGELIEDNLTRAFVQTIRMLSDTARETFLRDLFAASKYRSMLSYKTSELLSEELNRLKNGEFSRADVALQDRIPEGRDPRRKHRYYALERIVTISRGDKPRVPKKKPSDYTRPDAWIFDRDGSAYCMLVECKCRKDNPIDPDQIRGHGDSYFEWKADKDFEQRWLDLTWYDVLEAIDKATTGTADAGSASAGETPAEKQKKKLLKELEEFLGFYDYRLFRGFKFGNLGTKPSWRLLGRFCRLRFGDLGDVPSFKLFNSRRIHQ